MPVVVLAGTGLAMSLKGPKESILNPRSVTTPPSRPPITWLDDPHVVKGSALHEDREGLGMDAVVLHRVRTCLALHDGLERGHVGHVHA
jgi:hypothetical protein